MTQRRLGRRSLVALCLCGVLLAFIGIKIGQRSPSAALANVSTGDDPSNADDPSSRPQVLQVEVVKPTPGGLERSITLPGTVIAFESAQLFAKVPGFLRSQAVDIGDPVRQGQVLAEIDSPETLKAAEQAKAAVDQAKAQVTQADARVMTAEADSEAAPPRSPRHKPEFCDIRGARISRKAIQSDQCPASVGFGRKATRRRAGERIAIRPLGRRRGGCRSRQCPGTGQRGASADRDRLKPTPLPREPTWKSPKRRWRRPKRSSVSEHRLSLRRRGDQTKLLSRRFHPFRRSADEPAAVGRRPHGSNACDRPGTRSRRAVHSAWCAGGREDRRTARQSLQKQSRSHRGRRTQ